MDRRQTRKPKKDLDPRLPPSFSSDVFISSLLEALPRAFNGEGLDGFKTQYLHKELLSKYLDEDVVPAAERRSAAIRKFLAVEELNAKTNRRLYLNDADLGWTTSASFFAGVRAICSRVLGSVSEVKLLSAAYTNGASTSVRRSPIAAYEKLQGVQDVSTLAIKHWVNAASGTLLGSRGGLDRLNVRESSILFTVPKKSDIDRVACKEPSCNALLQRSVGEHIARRLRKMCGIDLSDQSRNRSLAQQALNLGLATIDLSSASDTITKQLVINCLPFEWWSLLSDLRVDECVIDDDIHSFEMFSSMGNGFTFELETLLFYAITNYTCRKAGVKGVISVYGDDIIASSAIVPRLSRVLSYVGFKLNTKKTHAKGPFRESCGGHYYRGFDVTPFYIKRAVTTLPDLINVLNSVLEWDGRGFGCFLTEDLYRWWDRWNAFVPWKLHGGLDPSDPSALVTGDSPRYRIKQKTRPLVINQNSGMIYWLMQRDRLPSPSHPLPSGQWVLSDVECKPIKECGRITLVRLRSYGERPSWQPKLLIEA